MTIGNALLFIKRGLKDDNLRKKLNTSSNLIELENVLITEQLYFSSNDFEDAFFHRLTQCQEKKEADQLKEFKMWWMFLSKILEPSGCETQI